jgi:hypothetical protein
VCTTFKINKNPNTCLHTWHKQCKHCKKPQRFNNLSSRHSDWHTTLDCAILPNTTGIVPTSKLDFSSWRIPKDIKLADEQFHQPGIIDLLIGADTFYEILPAGRRSRPGHYPVLRETFLGWTISGRHPHTTSHKAQSCFEKTTVWSTT